ncbi:MAG: type I methionyl aminopeptidase [Erysipelothrix sp.]|nr:type I methionyl aminopeptidase [Erysipelothrix sp.]
MIKIKSPREIELMREAGRVTALIHERMVDEVKVGVTLDSLQYIVKEVVEANDSTASFYKLYDFPGYGCFSLNEEVIHGIPDKRSLKDGDILSVDVGANYKGYHGDSAWTYAVGNISDEAKELLFHTKASLFKGLEQVKPGNRIGDIGYAIQSYLLEHGYDVPRDYTGHGVGSSLHEDPYVPNYGQKGTGVKLREGMTLAIEPMAYKLGAKLEVLDDDWTVVTENKTLSAHFEHTILVTKDGYEILTMNNKEDHTSNE